MGMENWKKRFLKENDGIDLHERNENESNKRVMFINNEEDLYEELEKLYQYYCDYERLKGLFRKYGYVVEENNSGVRVYKELKNKT